MSNARYPDEHDQLTKDTWTFIAYMEHQAGKHPLVPAWVAGAVRMILLQLDEIRHAPQERDGA